MAFQYDQGGWNNIRMGIEIMLVAAHAMGRTLVVKKECTRAHMYTHTSIVARFLFDFRISLFPSCFCSSLELVLSGGYFHAHSFTGLYNSVVLLPAALFCLSGTAGAELVLVGKAFHRPSNRQEEESRVRIRRLFRLVKAQNAPGITQEEELYEIFRNRQFKDSFRLK
jgi:hypothetical protein